MISHLCSSTKNNTPLLLALSFLSALLVAIVSGPQYIYPTFGGSLNDHFEWTPLESSFVSTACFIGVSFSGPLCSWLIENAGITKTLRISAILVFLGPLFVAETYAGSLPGSAFLCTLYLIFTGFAGAAAYLCALDSQSFNFQQSRGLSMGLTTAAVGISGIVFSLINDAIFSRSSKTTDQSESALQYDRNVYHYLYFLACTMSLCILFGSFFLGPLTRSVNSTHAYLPLQEEEAENSLNVQNEINLLSIKSSANLTPTTTTTATLFDNDASLQSTSAENHDTLKEKINDSSDPLSTLHIDTDVEKQLHVEQHNNVSITAADGVKDDDGLRATTAFFKHPFGFSLFCTLFTILGMGYVYLANIGKVIQSSISHDTLAIAEGAEEQRDILQEQQQHLLNLYIALFSLGNCGARAVFGAVSDLMTQKLKLHRLWIFVVAAVLMLSACIFLITHEVVPADSLKICTLFMASAYGIVFGVAPAATTEFGGTEAFAKNWGYLLFAPAFGSQLFNILFGYNFDIESAAQANNGGGVSTLCEGTRCFKATFQIGMLLGTLSLVILLAAIYRTSAYSHKKHFK